MANQITRETIETACEFGMFFKFPETGIYVTVESNGNHGTVTLRKYLAKLGMIDQWECTSEEAAETLTAWHAAIH